MTDPAGPSVERLQMSVTVPSGQVEIAADVPTGFVPVTSLVPVARRLGEGALSLEQEKAVRAGRSISCARGCAACCRMMVPLSQPEAFALRDRMQAMPDGERRAIEARLEAARRRLEQEGLWSRLEELAETDRQLSDDDCEAINRDYYALRLACPFLENEACSIYEDRPAACRELLVVTPPELCQDIVRNPVQTLPVPLRIGTILSMLWAELIGGPVRLIPLPVALSWADRHTLEGRRAWQGMSLFRKTLDQVWRYLSQQRSQPGSAKQSPS